MTAASQDTLRVLVVEDNANDVALVRRYLRDDPVGPIEVTAVDTLAAARDRLSSGTFDLVLLDLGLPDGNGVESISRLRETSEEVPIVVLTGQSDAAESIRAVRFDAQDCLLKDQLTSANLSRAIRHAVERHRWHDRYRRQLDMSPDGIVVLDTPGDVLFANQAAIQMFGRPKERLAAVVMRDLLAKRAPGGVAELETGRTVEVRTTDTDWHGRLASLITLRDITDRVRAEAQLRSVTEELRRSNERLEEMVTADPLTKVLNRRGIERALRLELDRTKRSGDHLTAILIDADDFKRINDSFGLVVGDAALSALCSGVCAALRSVDHVGRVGGDEFIVLLPGTGLAESIQVAEKLRRAIKGTRLPLVVETVTLSASLAVGSVGADVISLEEVLATLHLALRNSKRAGKDRVCIVGDSSEGREPTHGDLILIDAGTLEPDISLDVVFQGIQQIENERLIGFEALTRGPPGEFSSPGDLFRAAYEQDMLTTVDLRAFRAVLDRFKQGAWDCWYHVNLFPSTIINTPPEHLTRLLVDAGTDERVCIELSEQQFLGDPTYLRAPIENLRESGFRVAIDDVGYGRSSIEALMVLEPDVVKIDRKALQTVGGDAAERRQLERLIAMLRALDATVIVEGVETRNELVMLRDLGVQYAQGFLWGKPTDHSNAHESQKRRA